MKIFTNKKITQKIIILIITVILFNFAVPIQVNAVNFAEIGGDLLKEFVQLLAAVGDVVMGALNKMMLGTPGFTAMVAKTNVNLVTPRISNICRR